MNSEAFVRKHFFKLRLRLCTQGSRKLNMNCHNILKLDNEKKLKPGASSPGVKQYGDRRTDQPTDGRRELQRRYALA
jgi:hypothetical protein